MPTIAERRLYGRVAALGCILCGREAAIHHLTGLQHRAHGKKSSKVIPLCGDHHQNGGYGVAIHAGIEEWEKRWGTQEELWEQTMEALGTDCRGAD